MGHRKMPAYGEREHGGRYILDEYEWSRNHCKAVTIRRWKRDLKKKARAHNRRVMYLSLIHICTFAIMNFINAVSDYETEHGAALEGLKITTEKVTFTGFPTAPDHEHLTAFAQLAVLMNQQAISQKRIQAKDVNDENEKYALRTWLLRLGMNGPDFKETRKILMENLSCLLYTSRCV